MAGPPFVDGVTVFAEDLNQFPFGFVTPDTVSGASVTLSTTSTFASTASITYTVPTVVGCTGRRMKIHVQARFTMATGTSGRYTLQGGYNSGASASIGSFNGVGAAESLFLSLSGVNGSASLDQAGTVFLTPGQYTFYAAVARNANGTTTDTAANFYVLIEDIGAS